MKLTKPKRLRIIAGGIIVAIMIIAWLGDALLDMPSGPFFVIAIAGAIVVTLFEALALERRQPVEATDLEKVLDKKTTEFRSKPYREILEISKDVLCFNERFNDKSYAFEVRCEVLDSGRIKVMVDCARNIFPLVMFGKARYFAISPDGRTEDLLNHEVF